MANKHHAHTFTTLEAYLEYATSFYEQGTGLRKPMEEGGYRDEAIRDAKVRWKQHIEKHGNVPLIIKCGVCSGDEYRQDIKHGRYKRPRPNKAERDELKDDE